MATFQALHIRRVSHVLTKPERPVLLVPVGDNTFNPSDLLVLLELGQPFGSIFTSVLLYLLYGYNYDHLYSGSHAFAKGKGRARHSIGSVEFDTYSTMKPWGEWGILYRTSERTVVIHNITPRPQRWGNLEADKS
jgi:hypothetical protein